MADIYTDEVKKHIYAVKDRLPADFPLVTRDETYFIIIEVPMSNFAWRPVEDRLTIAIELERLKAFIRSTGVECEIEKC